MLLLTVCLASPRPRSAGADPWKRSPAVPGGVAGSSGPGEAAAPIPAPPLLPELPPWVLPGVPPPLLPVAPDSGFNEKLGGTLGGTLGGKFGKKLGERLGWRIDQNLNVLGKNAEDTHDRLERGMLQQVMLFDDYFGKGNNQKEQLTKEQHTKEQHTAFLLRWRNALRVERGGGVSLGTSLQANLQLSRISDRLNLAISGENNPDSFAPSLPEDPGNPGLDRTSFQNARIVNTELRYRILHTPERDFFLGAGVRLVWPPEAFARARYQEVQRLDAVTLARYAETVFFKTPYGPGETTELSLERSLDPKTLLRWASSGTLSQEIKALEWGSELSLLHELSTRSAITLTGGIYGNSAFDGWVNDYRLQVRYRRNFLRSWLYYELEPQVSWPRSAAGTITTNYAMTVRLEVVFQGKEMDRKLAP